MDDPVAEILNFQNRKKWESLIYKYAPRTVALVLDLETGVKLAYHFIFDLVHLHRENFRSFLTARNKIF